MNTTVMKLKDIKMNPSNPRVIKDEKFQQLVKSIQGFPEMLSIRPIVVNEDMVVLGGNMRLRACQEAKLKEVPVIIASELTPEQQREFIIKDNVGFGEWDFDMLANEWNAEELNEWGLTVPVFNEVNLDNFFNEGKPIDDTATNKIVLEYTAEEHEKVLEAFSKHSGTKEQIVFQLLNCE
jgi:hypothetical protein